MMSARLVIPRAILPPTSGSRGHGLSWARHFTADVSTLPFGAGTFTRASEGSYRTGAATFAWAASNVLRRSTNGDELMYLFEGPETQNLATPRDFSAWDLAGDVAPTVGAATTAPDGATDAYPVTFGAAANSELGLNTGWADEATGNVSVWAKGNGVATFKLGFMARTGIAYFSSVFTPPATWTRYDFDITGVGTGATTTKMLIRNGGSTAVTITFAQADGIDVGRFPQSHIRTGSATRAADVLTIAAANIPAWFLSGRWVVKLRVPNAPTLRVPTSAAAGYHLFSLNGNNSLYYYPIDQKYYLTVGGVATASAAVTYSTEQQLSLTVDFPAQTMTLAGFTTGDGVTAFTGGNWPSGTWYVGSIFSDTNNSFYGRMTEPRQI